MSQTNGVNANQQVKDEEGQVDSKIKETIIQARNRVDKTRFQLDVQEPLSGDVDVSEPRKSQIYAKMVKQYLVRIEPLLSSPEIKGNDQYYTDAGEEISRFYLVPPETDGYDFSLVMQDQDDKTLRRMIGLPKGVDLPEPEPVVFGGLKDVIEKPIVASHQWEVCVSKNGAPVNWDYRYPTAEQMVPDSVYRDALRQSDQFLQEIGIGVETGLPEVDDYSDEPF